MESGRTRSKTPIERRRSGIVRMRIEWTSVQSGTTEKKRAPSRLNSAVIQDQPAQFIAVTGQI